VVRVIASAVVLEHVITAGRCRTHYRGGTCLWAPPLTPAVQTHSQRTLRASLKVREELWALRRADGSAAGGVRHRRRGGQGAEPTQAGTAHPPSAPGRDSPTSALRLAHICTGHRLRRTTLVGSPLPTPRDILGALSASHMRQPTPGCSASRRLQVCIRPTFSSPPKHGACIVAKTVLNPELFAAWRVELKVWPKPHICAGTVPEIPSEVGPCER
jgi:hypothetical protein